MKTKTHWQSDYTRWFHQRGWKAHAFQKECAEKYFEGFHGLLNAPTGSGKTFALALPAILDHKMRLDGQKGLFLLWITPLKALSADIRDAIQSASDSLDANWYVALRNGDTDLKERKKQQTEKPQCLVTTPESLHLLLATKGYENFFKNLGCVVVDEWHELIGSKRGVQVELGLSRLRSICPKMRSWGISATIGNLDEARDILIPEAEKICTVISNFQKKTKITTVYPDSIETLPWAGHLGITLLPKILPVIEKSNTTLIFTNTRSQSEIWYQRLLDAQPSLAGRMAIHHGSLTTEVRKWVEEMLHAGELKAVVCTSSLDLGVDFRPVDSVIQIGSPKGVARFAQRAGRSGHQPGETSKIWFVPTHSLELIEAAALKTAVAEKKVESRIPVMRAFDVLIQYLMTLAVSDGFNPEITFLEIKQTHCFQTITKEEWKWILHFMHTGGDSLSSYDEYHRLEWIDGKYRVTNRKLAMQHRLGIGTIAHEQSMFVQLLNGQKLGTIEEYFISRLNPGDCFVFAGKVLELVRTDGPVAMVRKVTKKKGIVPSWQGGRMSLSSELSEILRYKIHHYQTLDDKELKVLQPLFELQEERSRIPRQNELLIESHLTEEGHHIFIFPFEGRMVNEGLAMLLAYRLSNISRNTFSIAMNDYGFELLSATEIPFEEGLEEDIFSTRNLIADLLNSTNYSEMVRRRFSEISTISGLVFKGFPGKQVRSKHLQANSRLFYEVFRDHDPNNLLLKQAEEEALYYQLEEQRLRKALEKIAGMELVITHPEKPTPLAFPIMVDRLREQLTNEQTAERIARIIRESENQD
ncbi:MAG: ligase-associated DNA damage response DEXH box helicase [Bacteroidetes bacterium]|nr:ligase-associated DNA damage response DEXH box helicase [Bacteroidota bacterium]